MTYNNKYQHTSAGSPIFLSYQKNYLGKAYNSGIIFIFNVFWQHKQNHCRFSLFYLSSLILRWLSKIPLACLPLLLLVYSFNSQALSTNTLNTIQGSGPYLTFDGGTTKVTTVDGLLGIKLSDGTTITPVINTSTASSPIILPTAGQSFANIDMSVPTTTNSITLNTLIGAPNNYWGDDDGDGQGTNGITVTGSLSLKITDKENQEVSRNTVLNMCNAPYKVVLSSTNGVLSTQYGDPNNSTFSTSSATYYISPKSPPVICYARPNLNIDAEVYYGPTNIWNPKKGFLLQSIEPATYGRNFPTTGANNLYFDLDIAGGSGPLTWPVVTLGGITATVKPTPYVTDGSNVRVILTGPVATYNQINSPSWISKPNLPQKFELVGYDSSNNVVIKYGFVLKQWFVNRGGYEATNAEQTSWCASIGYRIVQVKDLTNAVCANHFSGWFCQGIVGATPSSTGDHYLRNIGAGFFTEWGFMDQYPDAGFYWRHYWTSDRSANNYFLVDEDDADVYDAEYGHLMFSHAVCAYP